MVEALVAGAARARTAAVVVLSAPATELLAVREAEVVPMVVAETAVATLTEQTAMAAVVWAKREAAGMRVERFVAATVQ
jgi:hypothetical protein